MCACNPIAEEPLKDPGVASQSAQLQAMKRNYLKKKPTWKVFYEMTPAVDLCPHTHAHTPRTQAIV